ncbi:MAG: hypothetical protein RL213_1624 [Bacteroidota bacterium]
MEVLDRQLQEDPGYAQRLQDLERFTANYVAQQQTKGGNRTSSVVTIPVVYHIVYNTSAQNISDAQCIAQLNQLNLDFSKTNSDASLIPSAFASVAANTNIQFCLAQRSPTGASTTGIERRQTTVTSFSTNDAMKYYANGGLDAWPSGSYLNIWVCNMGGGILGYAQFPGGSSATDGVVLQYTTVGSMLSPSSGAPYNLGRTATHEVGHWLNLRHIWGDANCGSDQVNDTPTHNTSNYGCPTYPHLSTCTGTPVEMTMNYMDYTDDRCMYMFTAGQSARMNALFATGTVNRLSLLSSTGCTPVSTCGVPTGITVTNVTTSGATISWISVTGATSYNLTYCVAGTTNCTTVSSPTNSITISNLSPGTTYNYTLQSVCSNGTSSTVSGSFTTVATSCGNPTGLATSSITSSGVTLTWAGVSGAINYYIQYKTSTATSWTTTTSTLTSKTITGLSASTTYNWQVQAVCNGLLGTYVAGPNFTTAAGACTDTWESNNSSSAAKTISTNTNIFGLISSSTDKDWFKFTTTSPNTNIRIDLSNLPADYDIRLYSSTGTQLAISQNSATTGEVIIRNTTTATTYLIQVYGYNGVFNTGSCYTLRVNVASTTFRTAQEADASAEIFTDIAVNELTLYPNPAKDEVNILFNADASAPMNLQIIDMVGKTVYNRPMNVTAGLNKFGVDVADLVKGIYFVALSDSQHRDIKKLIIER